MSAMLAPAARERARTAYVDAVRQGLGPSHVVEVVIGAYLAAANDETHPNSIDPTLQANSYRLLADLQVGESTVFAATFDAGNTSRTFQLARKRLGNPQARWSAKTLADRTVQVTHLPNGASGKDPTRNATAVALAGLKVGEAKLFTETRVTGNVLQNAKRQARRILKDPDAEWTRRLTSKGMRVTRTMPKCDEVTSPHRLPGDVLGVMRGVAREHGITVADMTGPKKVRSFAVARWNAMSDIRAIQGPLGGKYSLIQVGQFLNRDHTAVIHGVRRWAEINGEAQP